MLNNEKIVTFASIFHRILAVDKSDLSFLSMFLCLSLQNSTAITISLKPRAQENKTKMEQRQYDVVRGRSSAIFCFCYFFPQSRDREQKSKEVRDGVEIKIVIDELNEIDQ